MNTVYFDIETNGLMGEADRVICLSYAVNEHDPVVAHTEDEIRDAVKTLVEADVLVGHNVIVFDLPMLDHLLPGGFKPKGVIRDTLVMSRLAMPDIMSRDLLPSPGYSPPPAAFKGSHSLKAWGIRLGMHKGTIFENTDFRNLQYSKEVGDYCNQDVRITRKLYTRMFVLLGVDSLILEHQFAECVAEQMRNGFAFDNDAAVDLYGSLAQERDLLTEELQKEIPPTEIKLKTKTKYIPFNPGSRQQIAKALQDLCGWKPEAYTDSGQAKVDENVLSSIDHPLAEKFNRYLLLSKRIGMLAEGNEAWMKTVNKHGRIHGYINHNGAVTGRCTHRGPNMAQVPSAHSPYGKECRSLFIAPPGRMLVGVDASGLELRCLAHYMAKYDNGAYASEILNGDIHTANQMAADLPTRSDAKVFIYAFLYGAGPGKIGSIIKGSAKDGKDLQERFLKRTPALKQLREDVMHAAEERGCLIGLDGRRLPVRSQHSALNTLLQSAGALIMKQATINMNWILRKHGIDYKQVGHIHDELQFEVAEDQAEQAAALLPQAITNAGEAFKFRCRLDGESKIGKNWSETH